MNQPQCGRLRRRFKQALATSKHHRESPHVVLVDQLRGLQRLDQVSTANDLQIVAIKRLECNDRGNYITAE